MNTTAKQLLEKAVVRSGLHRLARTLGPRLPTVLAYHNVVPDTLSPVGDRSLHLSFSRFLEHLGVVEEHFRVVTLEEALQGAPENEEAPTVAITFDDAYHGALTLAVEELRRRAMPATIFVAPGQLGRASFWWDALAGEGQGLDEELRQFALSRLQGREPEVRGWAEATGRALVAVPDALRPGTISELATVAKLDGISLASHSWSHPNLTRVTDEDLLDELEKPLTWLRERTGSPPKWLAYPYGRHDERVRRAASETGYRAALALDGGPRFFPSRDEFAIPRINVTPGVSREGFRLRVSGALRR